MHIAQLLDAFSLRPHVEIIKALLADMLRGVIEQAALFRTAFPSRNRQNSPREAEFERLHHRRGCLLLRFADQKMNVFRHDHIANNDELIALPHLLEHAKKQVPTPRSAEQWLPSVTTAGDEM
jgi:hypothetical protein